VNSDFGISTVSDPPPSDIVEYRGNDDSGVLRRTVQKNMDLLLSHHASMSMQIQEGEQEKAREGQRPVYRDLPSAIFVLADAKFAAIHQLFEQL
jgi:hypothetical protein